MVGGQKRPERQYLVKWEGYGPENNSREPETQLVRCEEAIAEYWKERQDAPALGQYLLAHPMAMVADTTVA
jgi:hypothetical protein